MSDEVQRPASAGDRAGWQAYWMAQGTVWRIEPEIDAERQRYLAARRAVTPDIARGVFPFRDEHGSITLSRADVEWLLAAHASGGIVGPVDWRDEQQRARDGLDLRGAGLQHADLSGLPLARLLGGLSRTQRVAAAQEQREAAALHAEGASFYDAHLEDAVLSDAHLEGAALGGTFGHRTHLERAKLIDAHLERADCSFARMDEAAMSGIHLDGATLYRAHLDRAELRAAQFAGANLTRAHFEGAWLNSASFAGRMLSSADVRRMLDAGTPVADALPPADVREAFFDSGADLRNVIWGDAAHGFALLGDIRWGGVNLVTTDWSHVRMLGDERIARQPTTLDGHAKTRATRLAEFAAAVRANRQLALALRAQGVNEQADRFAYRAQLLQLQVLRRQQQYARYLGSLLLMLMSGYGYRPLRSVITYAVVVLGFAVAYYLLGHNVAPALSPLDAVVFSLTSFHGRGFSPGQALTLHDPLTLVAAAEALVGLLIEITFIATFTQRFFAR